MVEETDAERAAKAERLAYEKGKGDAETDAHFREHDRHLEAINGSIDNMTGALDALKIEVATLKTKLAIYAALGSLVGGGVVALIAGLAAKAGGG